MAYIQQELQIVSHISIISEYFVFLCRFSYYRLRYVIHFYFITFCIITLIKRVVI